MEMFVRRREKGSYLCPYFGELRQLLYLSGAL
jgi:hypothetical protein